MPLISIIILCIHYALVSVLCLYGAHRIFHSLSARRFIKDALNSGAIETDIKPTASLPRDLPHVTIQTPMFNEKFVAARIIDAVCAFDYPKDKLQIQVIDDSNDRSVEIAAERVAYYKTLGFDIDHVRRTNRSGYKAGALAEAMDDVKGEFIAIFDADFIPHPDFLQRTLPMFKDEKIGLVQSRWTYLIRIQINSRGCKPLCWTPILASNKLRALARMSFSTLTAPPESGVKRRSLMPVDGSPIR